MQVKDILVTGGAGFIGSHLLDALTLKYPNSKVIVLDDFSNSALSLDQMGARQAHGDFDNLEILQNSVENIGEMDFGNWEISHIFHLAAQVNLRTSEKRPIFDA